MKETGGCASQALCFLRVITANPSFVGEEEFHPVMKAWIRRHGKFLLASTATWLPILLLWGFYGLFGHAAIEKAHRGEGFLFLKSLFGDKLNGDLEEACENIDHSVYAIILIIALLYVLFTLLYALRRIGIKRRYVIPVLLLYYLAVELLVAPHLCMLLGFKKYLVFMDPDHRPKNTKKHKGWNSDALRCRWESTDFKEEGLNLVFLGDSYTYGMRLRPYQAFPGKVERLLTKYYPKQGVKVANFAWTSSSPFLSLRRLKDIGHKYKPDFVILCLDMSDFYDDIQWKNMLERRGFYWYLDKVPLTLYLFECLFPSLSEKFYDWSNRNANRPPKRYFITEQPMEESLPYMDVILDSIEKTHQYSEELGARFMLLVLPRPHQYNARECPDNWEKGRYATMGPHALEIFQFFEDLQTKVDYPIYSLLKDFQATKIFPTCFDNDPHWNDKGTTVAAKAVTSLIRMEIRANYPQTKKKPPDERRE